MRRCRHGLIGAVPRIGRHWVWRRQASAVCSPSSDGALRRSCPLVRLARPSGQPRSRAQLIQAGPAGTLVRPTGNAGSNRGHTMLKNRERCGICGRLKGAGGCVGPHIESIRRLLRTVAHEDDPDPVDDLTPTERYSQAVERRDTAAAAKALSPRRRVSDEPPEMREASDQAIQSRQSLPRCPACNTPMGFVTGTADLLIYVCDSCRVGLSVKRGTD